MELSELIIKTHAHTHAAELAIKAESPDMALREMVKLRELLNDQTELEAGGAFEKNTPPEQ